MLTQLFIFVGFKNNFYHSVLPVLASDSLFQKRIKKYTEQFFHELNYNQTCIYYVETKSKQYYDKQEKI